MAVDKDLVRSGQNLAKAEHEFVKTSESFQEGSDLITNQVEKNRKADEDAEDREAMIRKRDREEDLAVMDLEQKVIQNEAQNAEWFNLISNGKKAGLLNDDVYNSFDKDREAWWKDTGNRMKLFQDVGDKEAFKRTLNTVVLGEKNIKENIFANIENVVVSESSPEALRIKRSIMSSAKVGSMPKPVIEGGKSYFVFPDPLDPDNREADVKLLAEDVANFQDDWSSILGDFKEPRTLPALQNEVIQKNDNLRRLLESKSARKSEIEAATLNIVKDIDTEAAVDETLAGIATFTGFDVDSFVADTGISLGDDGELSSDDFDSDPNTPGIQVNHRALAHLLELSLEAEYGEQTNADAERLDEKEVRIKQEKIESETTKNLSVATKNYREARELELGHEAYAIEQEENNLAYTEWFEGTDKTNTSLLDNVGEILHVRWNKDKWEITLKTQEIIEAGNDEKAGPNKNSVENYADIGDFAKYL